MLKLKKIMSVVLSLIMVFGVFSVAANAAGTVIDTAEILFNDDLAGLNADDYHEYVTVLTDGLDFDENYGDPGVFVYDEFNYRFHGEFEVGETYTFYIYLTNEEGYEIADYVEGNMNGDYVSVDTGSWTPDSNIYGDVEVYYVEFAFAVTVGGVIDDGNDNFDDYAVIDYAEITFDTDIAGYYTDEYDYYIDILTPGLEFEDNYGDPAVFVYDEYGNEYIGELESGETYTFYVFLSPLEGYEISDYALGYVNGEEVYSSVGSWYPDSDIYGDIEVDFIALEFDITVDGEKQFSLFDGIFDFFYNIYIKLLAMILIWFI